LETKACSLPDEPETDAFCGRHVSIQFQTGGQQLVAPLLHWSNQNRMENVSALCMERRDEIF
jgi:hypothetical protein